MTEQELTDWSDKFWNLYPSDLSHKKKGVRKKAHDAIKKLKFTQAQLDVVWVKTLQLMKYDRKCLQMGDRVDRWPHCSSYINQGYFDREIESTLAMETRIEGKKCACGKEAFNAGKFGWVCGACYNLKTGVDRMHYENLKKVGLGAKPGESKHDYCMRMKDAALNNHPEMAGLIGKGFTRNKPVHEAA